jgi:uncharacterized protein (TIGR04141 family)
MLTPSVLVTLSSLVASTRLTIYLLQHVSEASGALNPERSPASIDVIPGIEGIFYYEARPASPPAWLNYVQGVLVAPPQRLSSSSASGLLVLKSSGRFFAITFGYGRGLLDLSKIEHRFGLRVALNRIDPGQIRSLDTKTFEDLVVTKNTQTSRSSELPTFGVDVSRDILRAATGEPRDKSRTKRLSGSDALVLSVETVAADLPSLCGEMLAAYQEDTYREHFGWIDHLALVDDRSLRETLDETLVEQLQTRDNTSTYLAMPEAIGWEDIDAFKITGTRDIEYDDLDLDAYMSHLGDKCTDVSIDQLKARRVSVRFSRSGDFDARWTLYQCLISEQRLDSRLYVLIEGRWFVVSDSLVSEVDQFASSVSPGELSLLDARPGESERAYNKRVATESGEQFLLLDTQVRRPGGASSGIELCDLLAASGQLVHVKRKSRSSTLSHLFAQGTVSATTFLQDGPFRDEIRAVIENTASADSKAQWLNLVPDSAHLIDRSKYAVSYAVIANSSRPGNEWLPFFSKLNLMQSGRQVQNLGFALHLNRVAIADANA